MQILLPLLNDANAMNRTGGELEKGTNPEQGLLQQNSGRGDTLKRGFPAQTNRIRISGPLQVKEALIGEV